MSEDFLTPYPGVHRRADSGVFQFGLRAPADLAAHYPTGWAVRQSLKTADLRQANEKAKRLQAEWSHRFSLLRGGSEQAAQLSAVDVDAVADGVVGAD